MIREEIRQLKTGEREMRQFGLLVGGVAAGIGLFLWFQHSAAFPWFLWPGVTLAIFGWLLPRPLKPVYIVWMSLAIVMGIVVSTTLLLLLFTLVITPIGWVARWCGKDFLGLRMDRKGSSYWIRRPTVPRPKADYERQY